MLLFRVDGCLAFSYSPEENLNMIIDRKCKKWLDNENENYQRQLKIFRMLKYQIKRGVNGYLNNKISLWERK